MSEQKAIKLTVNRDFRELRRGNFAIASQNLLGRKWRSLLQAMALFSALTAITFGVTGQAPVWLGALVGAVGGAAAWGILMPLLLLFSYALSYFYTRSALKTNPSLAGPVDYAFSEAGLSYVSPNGNGDIRWTAFPWLRETREDFLLFVHRHLAHVLPKRCFAEASGIDEFKELLRRSYPGELLLLK